MRKTKTLLLTALAMFLLALPAMAQNTQRGGGRPNPDEILRNPRALARYLRLTPAQLESLKQLRQELQAETKPLHEQQKQLREQLRDQLEAANPDACTVGETMLDIHEIGDQVRAALEEFDDKFTAILTPEQRARYEALKEAARLLRGGEDE